MNRELYHSIWEILDTWFSWTCATIDRSLRMVACAVAALIFGLLYAGISAETRARLWAALIHDWGEATQNECEVNLSGYPADRRLGYIDLDETSTYLDTQPEKDG